MKYILAVIFLSMIICGCGQSKDEPKAFDYERSEKIMGTLVTLKANGAESKVAVDESFDKIFALVENIKVDVKILNESAGNEAFVKISPDVFKMLKISQRYSELTSGAFDVTCGAAVDLWRNARKNESLPTAEEIESVQNLIGFEHLHLDEATQSANLDLAGVKINLGGIGKGYGVDIARKIFVEHGITDGIIDFGTSSIFVFGKKKIGIKNPRVDNELSKVIELENSALSTSGDYEQYFILNGRRYHHIINPKTCLPTDNGVISASITIKESVEDCGTIADILSTAILVLGEENGKKLLNSLPWVKESIILTQ